MTESYKKLLDNFIDWGKSDDNVKAILVCGSTAYFDNRAWDQWSDLDLAIYAQDPSIYKSNHSWLNKIHQSIITFETDFFGNDNLPVIRVQFTNHLEADIGILPYDILNIKNPTPDILKVFKLGTKIALDKEGLLLKARERYLKYPSKSREDTTKEKMDRLIDELSIDIVHTSKKIARNDLYFAYLDMTNYLAERLINLIFIYHKEMYGEIDIIHDNLKNVELWADDFILEQLTNLFPSCNTLSLWMSMGNYLRRYI